MMQALLATDRRLDVANYGHFASGGIDMRIASVLPPVYRPKAVPRSWIRMNST
jgi:hypothetical protein